MKILLIDDDICFTNFLKTILTAHRYVVDVATNGKIGIEMVRQYDYDLILLDLVMPKLDGLTVCRQLRQIGCQVPILMLTGKSAGQDMITSLDAGADDYLTKPCETNHLLARIRALSRRATVDSEIVNLTWGKLSIDCKLVLAKYGETVIQLTPKQFQLLELFLRSPQQVFTRDEIINRIWSAEDYPSNNAVTNLIKDLRRKLKAAGMQEEVIETVYGLGYRLKDTQELAKNSLASKFVRIEDIAIIKQMQREFKQLLPAKIAELSTEIGQLKSPGVDAQQRALSIAHRLAGNLGTFGLNESSELASAMEQILSQEHLEAKDINELDLLLKKLSEPLPLLPDFNILEDLPWLMSPDDFTQNLEQECQWLSQNSAPGSLVLCAIDDFPTLEAHRAIQALHQLGTTLAKYIYPPRLITYYNHGNFGIFLPNVPLDATLRMSQHLYQAIRNFHNIKVSLGMTGSYLLSQITGQELLTTANEALISAQNRGGNTFCVYVSRTSEEITSEE